MFENTLRNMASDPKIVSYGNNGLVINSVLSAIYMVRNLSATLQSDRINDAFSMGMLNKVAELENAIVMLGNQRLSAYGINVYGMQAMTPLMPNAPMYNQQMAFPNAPMGSPMIGAMGGSMMPPPMMAPPMGMPSPMDMMSMQMPQQVMPQMQQPMQQAPPPPPPPQQAAAPPPPPPPQAAAAPPPATPVAAPSSPPPSAPPKSSSGGSGVSLALPGMGGGADEKAAGRDYLLKLLSEK